MEQKGTSFFYYIVCHALPSTIKQGHDEEKKCNFFLKKLLTPTASQQWTYP